VQAVRMGKRFEDARQPLQVRRFGSRHITRYMFIHRHCQELSRPTRSTHTLNRVPARAVDVLRIGPAGLLFSSRLLFAAALVIRAAVL
jgi:hypothetical protein